MYDLSGLLALHPGDRPGPGSTPESQWKGAEVSEDGLEWYRWSSARVARGLQAGGLLGETCRAVSLERSLEGITDKVWN